MIAPAAVLLIGLGIALVPHRPDPARDYPPLPRLDAEVARCEGQLRQATTPSGRDEALYGLARARARRAAALGKRYEAAGQWRLAIIYVEARRQVIERRRGVLCTEDQYREIHGELAIARAGLAQAEDRPEILCVELPKVVAFCEWRLQRLQRLRAAQAIHASEAAQEDEDTQRELRRARATLAAAQRRLKGRR